MCFYQIVCMLQSARGYKPLYHSFIKDEALYKITISNKHFPPHLQRIRWKFLSYWNSLQFLSASSSKARASTLHYFLFFCLQTFMNCGVVWWVPASKRHWATLVLGWETVSMHYSCLWWLCALTSRPKPLLALFHPILQLSVSPHASQTQWNQ